MRLSALFVTAILLVSVSLPAQRGGGASSGGSHSSGGSSGGSFHGGSASSAGSPRSSVSPSYSSSRRSNSSTTGSDRSSSGQSSRKSSSLSERSPKDPASIGLNIRPNLLKSPASEKVDEKPEKKGVFSFLHHKKPAPEPMRSRSIPASNARRDRVVESRFAQPVRPVAPGTVLPVRNTISIRGLTPVDPWPIDWQGNPSNGCGSETTPAKACAIR